MSAQKQTREVLRARPLAQPIAQGRGLALLPARRWPQPADCRGHRWLRQQRAGPIRARALFRVQLRQPVACHWPLPPADCQYPHPCQRLGPAAGLPQVAELPLAVKLPLAAGQALPSLWGLAQRLARRRPQADCRGRRWKTFFAARQEPPRLSGWLRSAGRQSRWWDWTAERPPQMPAVRPDQAH